MVKFILRLKGGEGSGNFGHEGRPGEVGGSSTGGGKGSSDIPTMGEEESIAYGKQAMEKIYANKYMRRIAIGYMADGSIDDVANVAAAIDDTIGGAYYMDYAAEADDPVLEKFFDQFETARASEGYYTTQNNKDPKRLAFEKYYYGRELGGFGPASDFADTAIKDFLKTGKVPGFASSSKPKSVDRKDWVRELDILEYNLANMSRPNSGYGPKDIARVTGEIETAKTHLKQ